MKRVSPAKSLHEVEPDWNSGRFLLRRSEMFIATQPHEKSRSFRSETLSGRMMINREGSAPAELKG